jgi:membrane-associated phospholipid phosphatase
MRGNSVTTALSGTVPEVLIPVLIVVTGLGDPVFVVALAMLVYWFGPRYDLLDRRTGATVLAVSFVALAATMLLKAGFAMPRPPADVMLIPEDGGGFPSGHATGAAATYAALAVFLDRWSRTLRYRLAAVVVVVVALSRVLLGVHYVVDVLVGIAVGLLVLVAVRYVAIESVTKAFAMAIPLALGGTLLASSAENALQTGLVSGATLGWWLVADSVENGQLSTGRIVAAGMGGLVLLAVGYESGLPIVAGLTGAAAGALLLAVPGLGD